MRALVVAADAVDLARAAAARGATVVVVGSDAAAAGALAREVDDAGGRGLVFVGEPASGALRELLAELLTGPRPAAAS